MKEAFVAAAIQMVSGASLQDNLAEAGRLIGVAAERGARLAALPEYFCLMGKRETDKLAIAENPGEGIIQDYLAGLAREHNIWLSCGSIPLVSPDNGRVFNTQLIYDPSGKQIARYDKIHLFSFTRGEESYDEARGIVPGKSIARVETDLATLGEVDLILVPSAFTYTTGKAHWEILLRARAIENQCYVLAPAQGGRHENGRRTWGHSMLIDPWGDVLDVLPEHAGIVSGTIDPQRLQEVRQSLPALRHRTI